MVTFLKIGWIYTKMFLNVSQEHLAKLEMNLIVIKGQKGFLKPCHQCSKKKHSKALKNN